MIRPITEDDSASVVGLAVASGLFGADETEPLDGMLADYFGGAAEDGHACVIDEEGGEPVGVAYYQPKPVADRVWDLTLIAVRADRQGRGRGTALMRHVEDALREDGQRMLLVETSGAPDFGPTRGFYAKLGYGEEARVHDFYASGDDMVLFRKVLNADRGTVGVAGEARATDGGDRTPVEGVEIERLETEDELDSLEPLWVALHRLHRGMLPPGTVVADDAVSWRGRRGRYGRWMADGALVLLARQGGAPVGYALAHFHEGPDETFAVGARYAELASLSVAPGSRGKGIGTRLLDELDRLLAQDGVFDLVVSVMSDNADALRFYRRRGLRPAETYLWRVAAAEAPATRAHAGRKGR